jgi:hypothetical protein
MYSIRGSSSRFPNAERYPLPVKSPAGPVSLPWPVDYYRSLQPQLGGLAQNSARGSNGDVWKWVLGTVVVMLVLRKQR